MQRNDCIDVCTPSTSKRQIENGKKEGQEEGKNGESSGGVTSLGRLFNAYPIPSQLKLFIL